MLREAEIKTHNNRETKTKNPMIISILKVIVKNGQTSLKQSKTITANQTSLSQSECKH